MNIVLFTIAELAEPLPRRDPRAVHVLDVLKRRQGDTFEAGVIDGSVGMATLVEIGQETLTLAFQALREPPPLPPLTLLIGLPRPQTARDILRDATTLGVAAIHFVKCGRSDANYAGSALWSSGEWRRHLIAGAAQACDTRLPAVTWTHTLERALAALPAPGTPISGSGGWLEWTPRVVADALEPARGQPLRFAVQPQSNAGADGARRGPLRSPVTELVCLALDNYEASRSMAEALSPLSPSVPLVLALGPERGWDVADRAGLRAAGFQFAHLGRRVLRVETAMTAAVALAHACTRRNSEPASWVHETPNGASLLSR